jgi:hypothetical protein
LSDTPPSGKQVSEKEQGEQERDSVFDFLYHDARRVGSFLAQFDDAGHLQQITQSESRTKGLKRGWKFALGGGMGEFGSGEASVERGPGEGGSEASERVYDPLWANARTLLDYLFERNMIQRDIWEARLGQFVLVEGRLVILDVAMLKGAWDKPAIRKIVTKDAGVEHDLNRHLRRKQAAVGGEKPVSEVEVFMDLLGILPHSLQAHILGDKFTAWCSLATESLVGLSSDLVLKHGTLISGDWHVLGVLDAQPERGPESDKPMKLTPLEEAVAGLAGTLVGTLVARLSPVTRRMLGRPYGAHGLTPLLIFREVSG